MRAARGGAGRVSGGSVCLFVLAVDHSLVDHCSLANPVERPEALRILLQVGVESAADMCHLEQDACSSARSGRIQSRRCSTRSCPAQSLADTSQGVALLPIPGRKLLSCIYTKLCGSPQSDSANLSSQYRCMRDAAAAYTSL